MKGEEGNEVNLTEKNNSNDDNNSNRFYSEYYLYIVIITLLKLFFTIKLYYHYYHYNNYYFSINFRCRCCEFIILAIFAGHLLRNIRLLYVVYDFEFYERG